jgi:hypothetical protein
MSCAAADNAPCGRPSQPRNLSAIPQAKTRLMIIPAPAPMGAAAAEDWGRARFLVGKWTGEGSGQPRQSAGAFSFTRERRACNGWHCKKSRTRRRTQPASARAGATFVCRGG